MLDHTDVNEGESPRQIVDELHRLYQDQERIRTGLAEIAPKYFRSSASDLFGNPTNQSKNMNLDNLPSIIRQAIKDETTTIVNAQLAMYKSMLAERDVKISNLGEVIIGVKNQNEEILFQLETNQMYIAETTGSTPEPTKKLAKKEIEQEIPF